MKIYAYLTNNLILVFVCCSVIFSCTQDIMEVDDSEGVLGETNAPVSFNMKLNKSQKNAAEEGRLGLLEISSGHGNENLIPVQVEDTGKGSNSTVVMIMPEGEPGVRRFKLTESESFFDQAIKVNRDPGSGQIIVAEEDEKVLRYNYQTVYEDDVVRLDYEELERHIRIETDTFVTTSIYAVPRSNYIHPLYGLEGEMLTRDWPEGAHPHHRGIYWAWPEVEYGSKMGDLHALQTVFSRPTGELESVSGPVFAQVLAENLWMWEDTEPIVREHTLIRVYRASSSSRVIDLAFKFVALKEGITLATRGKKSYGGLNVRMQLPESQEISYFTGKSDSKPVRAWSDLSGKFEGAESPSGLMVLQHQGNPDYPGTWVEYPDLSWVQPTFPAQGTRYSLVLDEPLVLRFRLVVHVGGKPAEIISKKRWDAFHKTVTPLYSFGNTR